MMRADATSLEGACDVPFSVYGVDGAVEVECGATTVVGIYATTGQLVTQPMLEAGRHTIALPTGVYIVNGNKVIVK
jgi:hypothetical protein